MEMKYSDSAEDMGEAPMNRAFESTGSHEHHAPRARDWRKGMSDNVAYALLIYTGLQIFMTVQAMKDAADGSLSILPYLALVALVAAIIPACRVFERRWRRLSDEEAADPALRGSYRRDQFLLWLMAIGLPFVLTGLFKAIATIS